jgi:8-oxo-dGTP pyrophosphatase MutT (NUDIX family)
MQEAKVVTCFLLRRSPTGGEVLLLRRSQQVGTYRGLWAGVSGYLEEATALAQAYREIEEEVGLTPDEVTLLRTGEPLVVSDTEAGRRWVVHPFLFEVRPNAQVQVDWEHTEARWVRPETVSGFETVPQLTEALMRVYPPQRP